MSRHGFKCWPKLVPDGGSRFGGTGHQVDGRVFEICEASFIDAKEALTRLRGPAAVAAILNPRRDSFEKYPETRGRVADSDPSFMRLVIPPLVLARECAKREDVTRAKLAQTQLVADLARDADERRTAWQQRCAEIEQHRAASRKESAIQREAIRASDKRELWLMKPGERLPLYILRVEAETDALYGAGVMKSALSQYAEKYQLPRHLLSVPQIQNALEAEHVRRRNLPQT